MPTISSTDGLELLEHHADARLSEGPVWDAERGRLLWVDIMLGRVHALAPDSGAEQRWQLDRHVGAVAPRAGGGLVVADEHGFSLLEEDPAAPAQPLADLLGPGLRMNDGACDPLGRFWAGSMAYDETPGAGHLYRLEGTGQATPVLANVTISNGLGWSPDESRMYFADSGEGRVDAFDWPSFTGRRTVIEIPGSLGVPDGLAVDAEGAIWVAVWGGGCVRRYGGDGVLLGAIELPVAQVTSCAFGGPDLDELYITTAAHDLSPDDRRSQPLAGAVFRCRPGVRGLPATPYAG
jgi:sugar lactone lactonase YvrE